MLAVCPRKFTSVDSLSSYLAFTEALAVAPTSSQAGHPSWIARTSSISIFLYLSALIMMLKSVTANGVRAIWNTLVPRFAILFSTYRFAPWTMVITAMSVATPIVSPSMVSDARSLCAESALTHCPRLSRMASIGFREAMVPLLYQIHEGPMAQHGSGEWPSTCGYERIIPRVTLGALRISLRSLDFGDSKGEGHIADRGKTGTFATR